MNSIYKSGCLASILLLMLIYSSPAFSQYKKAQNLPYADQKNYHFGFSLGMHIQDMPLVNTGFTQDNGEIWYATIPTYSPGFNIGLIADYYLSQYFNLRTNPSIYFGEKKAVFKDEKTEHRFEHAFKSNYLIIPIHLKINGSRTNNYRPYLLAGAYTSISVANKKNEALRFNTFDYGLEFGVGFNIYLQYFKLSPELRFSFGLKDIINKNRKDLSDPELLKYSQAVSSGKNRIVSLIFNFE